MSGKALQKPLWMVRGEKNPCVCGGVHLNEKQFDIWKLYAESHTIKEIALMVGLSAKGVEHHMAKLQRKLETYGAARLTVSAARNGIIEV